MSARSSSRGDRRDHLAGARRHGRGRPRLRRRRRCARTRHRRRPGGHLAGCRSATPRPCPERSYGLTFSRLAHRRHDRPRRLGEPRRPRDRHAAVLPGPSGRGDSVAYKLDIRGRAGRRQRVSDGLLHRRRADDRPRVRPPPLLLPIVASRGGLSGGDRLHPRRDRSEPCRSTPISPSPRRPAATSASGGSTASAGAQWTTGWPRPSSFNLTLYGPDGGRLNPAFPRSTRCRRAASTRSSCARGLSSNAAAVTIRVNTAAPPEPIVLTALDAAHGDAGHRRAQALRLRCHAGATARA